MVEFLRSDLPFLIYLCGKFLSLERERERGGRSRAEEGGNLAEAGRELDASTGTIKTHY